MKALICNSAHRGITLRDLPHLATPPPFLTVKVHRKIKTHVFRCDVTCWRAKGQRMQWERTNLVGYVCPDWAEHLLRGESEAVPTWADVDWQPSL